MSVGIWQLLLILAIVLVLFGAGKLPKIMGDLAKGIKLFKKEMNGQDQDHLEGKKDDKNQQDKS
jgi:sec-independent protein translocase protein TatA